MATKLLIESNFETETLTEASENGTKNWFIRGIFMQSDVKNRNGRIYPRGLMEQAVGDYDRNYVQTKQATGELTHPSTTQIDLHKVSHLIEEIKQDGNNFMGKARILNTPTGNIVKGLLEGGVRLGVSSRGNGSVVTESSGIDRVQNFILSTVDIVAAPSAPDAFVTGMMESHDFIWNTTAAMSDAELQKLERIKHDVQMASKNRLQEATLKAFSDFMGMIKAK